MKTLGDKIRHWRIQKDLSQADMAKELGITVGAYSKIERDSTDPNYKRIEAISKILGMTVVDLLNTFSKEKNKIDWEKIIIEKDAEIMKLQKQVIELLVKKK